jgi:PAS domain S-box-containing protein
MLAADVNFLPVVDEKSNYLGIVTMRTLITTIMDSDLSISDIIESDVYVVCSDSDFADVPASIDHFVVLNKDKKVEGIVTTAQFVRCLLDFFFGSERMVKKYSVSGKDSNLIKALTTESSAIISSSYDGIFITDGEGVVLKLNEAYERITGVKANEIIGKSMAKLVKEGVYDQSVTLLVLERQESVTINQIVKPTNKHILVTGNPVFNRRGKIIRVVTNVRDVTELVNLQSKLSKIEAEKIKYQTEISYLRSLQLKSSDIIFRSKAMAPVVELAVKVADVSSTVLITGESGTGKELIAKLIHREGKGGSKPFIKINCGAIPESLLESELFGHERGAFTGARKEGKPGLFELANSGTLFLDEIGEMPTFLQVKLLRAIQEKTVTRVGGITPIKVDVRIVAATHRDLVKMVQEGNFREDLYYRLMVVPIRIPPLRERKEDIPLLVMHFIEKFNKRFGFQKTISSPVIDKLTEYPWPGNVRELENVIERMMVTTPENELTIEVLPSTILQSDLIPKIGAKLKDAVAHTEKVLLYESFQQYGSWYKVADILGIDRTTAFRKAVKYGLIEKRKN